MKGCPDAGLNERMAGHLTGGWDAMPFLSLIGLLNVKTDVKMMHAGRQTFRHRVSWGEMVSHLLALVYLWM
jgi:hypothetical protein